MQVHLAMLYKEYLDKILSGEKTVEGRFSKVRCLPHGRVSIGDKVFLKETSGPVVALAGVSNLLAFTDMTQDQANHLVETYGSLLCLEQDFIARVLASRYATLIFLEDVKPIQPIRIEKRDRRPWVILTQQTDFFRSNDWQDTLWKILAAEKM